MKPKRKPREFWIVLNKAQLSGRALPSIEWATDYMMQQSKMFQREKAFEMIRVREVPKPRKRVK